MQYSRKCGSTKDFCFGDPGSILILLCWKFTMVKLPEDDPFWSHGCRLFVGQPSHKNNSLPLSRDKNLHLSFSIMLKLGMKLHILLTVVKRLVHKWVDDISWLKNNKQILSEKNYDSMSTYFFKN